MSSESNAMSRLYELRAAERAGLGATPKGTAVGLGSVMLGALASVMGVRKEPARERKGPAR